MHAQLTTEWPFDGLKSARQYHTHLCVSEVQQLVRHVAGVPLAAAGRVEALHIWMVVWQDTSTAWQLHVSVCVSALFKRSCVCALSLCFVSVSLYKSLLKRSCRSVQFSLLHVHASYLTSTRY